MQLVSEECVSYCAGASCRSLAENSKDRPAAPCIKVKNKCKNLEERPYLRRDDVAVLDVVYQLLAAPQSCIIDIATKFNPSGGIIKLQEVFGCYSKFFEYLKAKSVSPTASYAILCHPFACSAPATSSLMQPSACDFMMREAALLKNGGNNLLLPLET